MRRTWCRSGRFCRGSPCRHCPSRFARAGGRFGSLADFSVQHGREAGGGDRTRGGAQKIQVNLKKPLFHVMDSAANPSSDSKVIA